jgi:hypothetical protein
MNAFFIFDYFAGLFALLGDPKQLAILQVLTNPAVLPLLKIIWLLYKLQCN